MCFHQEAGDGEPLPWVTLTLFADITILHTLRRIRNISRRADNRGNPNHRPAENSRKLLHSSSHDRDAINTHLCQLTLTNTNHSSLEGRK